MAKASALVGVPFEEGRWEEAQTVRIEPDRQAPRFGVSRCVFSSFCRPYEPLI